MEYFNSASHIVGIPSLALDADHVISGTIMVGRTEW